MVLGLKDQRSRLGLELTAIRRRGFELYECPQVFVVNPFVFATARAGNNEARELRQTDGSFTGHYASVQLPRHM